MKANDPPACRLQAAAVISLSGWRVLGNSGLGGCHGITWTEGPLSPNEELALRRLALGTEKAHALSRRDLDRLKHLGLIIQSPLFGTISGRTSVHYGDDEMGSVLAVP
jgi:hypothetical protein